MAMFIKFEEYDLASYFFHRFFAKISLLTSKRVAQGREARVDEGGRSDRERRAVGGAGPVSRRLLLSYFPERWLEGNFSSVELKLAPARNAYGIFNSAASLSFVFPPLFFFLSRSRMSFGTSCLTFSEKASE